MTDLDKNLYWVIWCRDPLDIPTSGFDDVLSYWMKRRPSKIKAAGPEQAAETFFNDNRRTDADVGILCAVRADGVARFHVFRLAFTYQVTQCKAEEQQVLDKTRAARTGYYVYDVDHQPLDVLRDQYRVLYVDEQRESWWWDKKLQTWVCGDRQEASPVAKYPSSEGWTMVYYTALPSSACVGLRPRYYCYKRYTRTERQAEREPIRIEPHHFEHG